MKYIRTKDGRIINCRFSKQEYEMDYPNSKVSYERWFELAFETDTNYEILKQADTIEELCDEFIVLGYFAYQDLPVLIKSSNKQQEINIAKNMKNENNKVYGAIWTDKGLIYVAKMNDKGELELL